MLQAQIYSVSPARFGKRFADSLLAMIANKTFKLNKAEYLRKARSNRTMITSGNLGKMGDFYFCGFVAKFVLLVVLVNF